MYYKRYIENEIEKRMHSSDAILVTGPKNCGKTTTSTLFSKSIITLNTKENIDLIKLDPKKALEGEKPHLIDEWQTVPNIWNYIKESVDNDKTFGEYILTGSTTPANYDEIYHSGAGRIVTINMRTMSLFESLESKGTISLSHLFNNNVNIFDLNKNFTIDDIAYLICRGGWPLSIQIEKKCALDVTENYYKSLFNYDNSSNLNFKNKKPEVFKLILASYARNISTECSYNTIISDLEEHFNFKINIKTFIEYIECLKELFIIDDLDAWSPNYRSKTIIRTSPTRHFVDTSIATLALGLSPKDLINDLKTFGLLFEDFAIRDLRVYSENIDGTVKHYRDNTGLEVDAIIHLKNGNYGAIEIKLGGEDAIKKGTNSLLRFKNKISNNKNKDPSFLMILTAFGPAYKTKEGIYVVPINLLKD